MIPFARRVFFVLLLAASCALGGAYNSSTPQTLEPGQTIIVWNAETPTPGNGTTAASQ